MMPPALVATEPPTVAVPRPPKSTAYRSPTAAAASCTASTVAPAPAEVPEGAVAVVNGTAITVEEYAQALRDAAFAAKSAWARGGLRQSVRLVLCVDFVSAK